MGFFDDLGKKVTDAGQKTMQKAQEMSEVARINSLISQNESKINNVYYQIGKLFVSIYGNDCREEFAGMVATVAELEQQNATYKKQIQEVKGIQHCEKCGAEVAMGVAFCSSCGITPQFYTWSSGYASVLTDFTYAGGDHSVTFPSD